MTSTRQFGFKKAIGCSHSTYLLKESIQYFTSNDSNVSMCMLDLSRAFDKLNHWGLYIKLMERKIPLIILRLIINLFSKLCTVVAWNGARSSPVVLRTGCRQGAILSPTLFSVYVDDLLLELSRKALGCRINGFCFNSLMYADDLMLLAITISDLRILLKISVSFFEKVDMPINIAKSKCIRIGNGYRNTCVPVFIADKALEWVQSFRYLGINIVAGCRYACDYGDARKKFLGAFNAIYGRIGNKNTTNLSLSLLSSKCLPSLIYGAELLDSQRQIARLCYTYDRTWMKIFGTFDVNTIRVCQYYSNTLPLDYQLNLRKFVFLNKLNSHPDPQFKLAAACFRNNYSCVTEYGALSTDSLSTVKFKM